MTTRYASSSQSGDHDFNAWKDGQVWDPTLGTPAYVAWADGDFANYRIAATALGGNEFSADLPDDATNYQLRVRDATLADSFVVFRWDLRDTLALADNAATLASILAKTDLIGTFKATVPVREDGNSLVIYIGETHSVTIETSEDLSAVAMEIVFDDSDQAEVAVIADGSITKTASSIEFAVPAAVSAKAQTLSYAVRRTSNDEVLLHGRADVQYQPLSS